MHANLAEGTREFKVYVYDASNGLAKIAKKYAPGMNFKFKFI